MFLVFTGQGHHGTGPQYRHLLELNPHTDDTLLLDAKSAIPLRPLGTCVCSSGDTDIYTSNAYLCTTQMFLGVTIFGRPSICNDVKMCNDTIVSYECTVPTTHFN